MSLALLACLAGAPAAAVAQSEADQSGAQAVHPFAPYVVQASRRFGIPEHWIWAVMRAESGGNVRAVSRAGAMGLMQIMPGTWTDLRARYGLGRDPFDPSDNIMAGTAYLREMHNRYGDAAAMLAAYNAGPGRYDDHRSTGRPLPGETRAYVAGLLPMVGGAPDRRIVAAPADVLAWTRAPLFSRSDPNIRTASRPAADPPDIDMENASPPGQNKPGDSLFVPLSRSRPL